MKITNLIKISILICAVLPFSKAFAVGELTCTASADITYSPGLRLFEQQTDITFDVGYSGCTSLTGSTITGGSRSGSFTGSRSCLALPASGSATIEIYWDDGQTSVVDATTQSTDAAGQTVHILTGPIISGPFAGKIFSEELVQASLDLLSCLVAPGVESQTGVGTAQIL
ncbi:hypothetical protein [Microbulbifer halophilus]|uniref:Uncharacterized protein n=1 Tax=Microbulbifer halophilus TaxID=453963 RepID=A0ABW5E7E0_9GAMM|nr:hypothetical protein [Microbulbifer halophilus]MCW8126720.1 hypothetical protein [Microbulbifer halophilus]